MNRFNKQLAIAICLASWSLGGASVFAAEKDSGASPKGADAAFFDDESSQARQQSDLALHRAVQKQEAGINQEAIELFKEAMALDPTNAEAFRRYGDYLIMYRGVEGLTYYLKAKELIDKNPEAYDDDLKKNLKRSMQILYRDYQWGVPLMVNQGIAVFFAPYIEYSMMGERQLYMDTSDLSAEKTFDAGVVEREEGLAWFEPLLAEQKDGIKWFQDVAEDNKDGIAYFEGRIPEIKAGKEYFENLISSSHRGFRDWHTYITNYYWVNFGYIPSEDEILDYDAQGNPITIKSRRKQVLAEIKSYEVMIDRIEEDLVNTLHSIDLAKADLETNQEKEKLAATDAATTQERIDQINAELEKIRQAREEIKKKKTRKPKVTDYGADVKVVFPALPLPDVWLYAKRIDAKDAGIAITETYDLHDIARTYTELGASLGQRTLLGYNWDINWWAGVRTLKSESKDETLDEDYYTEELLAYNFKPKLSFSMPQKTLSLNTEFEFGDISKKDEIYDIEEGVDDHINSQVASLRFSIYPKDETVRFGQNKSIHFEAGVRRVERDYRNDRIRYDEEGNRLPDIPTVVEEDLQPFVVVEPLGLLRGRADCPVKYAFHQMSYSSGSMEGTYRVHEVTAIPTWVPIYRLYDRAFLTGVEEMRLGFPLKFSTGDGDNDYYGAGAKFETRLVTGFNFVIRPTLEVEFRDYHEIDEQEWGGRIKLLIAM